MFVSPLMNHNNSVATNLKETFFVVNSGNPLDKSKQKLMTKFRNRTLFVRSFRVFPISKTSSQRL